MHPCIVKTDCSGSVDESGQRNDVDALPLTAPKGRFTTEYLAGLIQLARESRRPAIARENLDRLSLGIDWRALHPVRRVNLHARLEGAAWALALGDVEEDEVRVSMQRWVCEAFAPGGAP